MNRKSKIAGFVVFFSAFFASAFAGASANHGISHRYALYGKECDGQLSGDGFVALRLYNRVTHRAVWRRKLSGYGAIGWSEDRRAFAVRVEFLPSSREAILVWREGRRPRLLPLRADYLKNYDYEFGKFVWNRSHSKVLFRAGSSGAFDGDLGSLLCIDISKRKLYEASVNPVRKMVWTQRNTVHYWTGSFATGKISKKPKIWRCP